VGDGPIRYVFCHGLFGRGRNWTGLARQLQPAASLLVDLPNHGESPWTDRFSYPEMAHSLAGLLGETEAASGASRDLTLVGHSMGGRVAMLTALAYPELVRRLVVVDVAPAATPGLSVGAYARALQDLGPEDLITRRAADRALIPAIPDPRTRACLLTGYQPSSDGPRWRFNLNVLSRDLDQILGWPDPGPIEPYPGPVLWLAGAESPYITAASHPAMQALFPRYRLETIAGAGHWVHADAPQAFLEALTRFVAETSPPASQDLQPIE
jgi:pimeloyl-ACP methyl ester carboxylesterase